MQQEHANTRARFVPRSRPFRLLLRACFSSPAEARRQQRMDKTDVCRLRTSTYLYVCSLITHSLRAPGQRTPRHSLSLFTTIIDFGCPISRPCGLPRFRCPTSLSCLTGTIQGQFHSHFLFLLVPSSCSPALPANSRLGLDSPIFATLTPPDPHLLVIFECEYKRPRSWPPRNSVGAIAGKYTYININI